MPDISRGAVGWLPAAAAVVAGVTLLRVIALAFNRTDLFVDEAQYWLWGQHFDFGYYSKPPLLAWAIGASTWLAGSDAPFWVRLPAVLAHAPTALLLAAAAARVHGNRVAVWTAAAYVTLPMVSMGSLLIGADAMMTPFLAAAFYFFLRALEARPRPGFAFAAGLAAGAAFLGKYAAIYFLAGVALAALRPATRLGARQAGALVAGFVLVALPNLLWNRSHGFATIAHTADNTGWAREGVSLDPAGLATFLLSQFGVFGPVLFATLLWMTVRRGTPGRRHLAFVAPPLALVSLQALASHAYANWAASAYLAGSVAVMAALERHRRLLWTSLGINAGLGLFLILVSIVPGLRLGGEPLGARYLGRAEMSRQIIAAARAAGATAILAERRDVLADLFYTGRDAGIPFYAPQPAGRPMNHYEQVYPLPDGLAGKVLVVSTDPLTCAGVPVAPVAVPEAAGGAYARRHLAFYIVPAECAHAVF